ncbi:PduM family microcompartment protein [Enterococcus xiangfangensis]|uniref:PduM family microcompartment protein n=1 Tax=Enterococcus xiangfangensis TaxID=1296537 RepID=UPI003D17B867|nr:microcompartment protein PduM [Enterococcus asini]
MDEEKLISLIIERLTKREKARLNLLCQKNFVLTPVPDKRVFFDYHQIGLIQVPVQLIHDLYYFEKEPWIDWLLTGIYYQVQFVFDISEQTLAFIPWKMLTQWPLEFHINGEVVSACKKSTIKREDLLLLKEGSLLVKTNQQKITAEAYELIQRKKIKVTERIDESCIWGK